MSTEPVLVLRAPVSGRTVALGEVPDPVFATGMVGFGIAIEPEQGVVRAPADGEVTVLFPTHHALALVTAEGLEILIHVGIESVKLNGMFTACVAMGQAVKAGDILLRFDLPALRQEASSSLCPLIVTRLPAEYRLEMTPAGETVTAGVDPAVVVFRKEVRRWSN
ncbi:MAG TPA: PTS glucose transporter subunit IIA [Symbiobacteriaceae bacterium]|jgi:PTS system glucose-specific IIA component